MDIGDKRKVYKIVDIKYCGMNKWVIFFNKYLLKYYLMDIYYFDYWKIKGYIYKKVIKCIFNVRVDSKVLGYERRGVGVEGFDGKLVFGKR